MDIHLRQFRRFAQYNRWFNQRLYSLIASLPDEERKRDRGAFFRSIHGTLNHVLMGDRIWLGRFSRMPGGFRALEKTPLIFAYESLGQVLYEDFDELARQRAETDHALSAWVQELTGDVLHADLKYTRSGGETLTAPVWHVIAHLFNHQTHHRGQLTTLLFQLGHDPGITDFLVTAFMPEDAVE